MEQSTASRNGDESSIASKKLILMCGLPGAGKTTTAHRIRRAMNDAIVISRDYFRNPYRGNGCLNEFSYKGGTIVDRIFFARAKDLLSIYTTIILDATFRLCEKRIEALDFANNQGCQFFIIECICSYDTLMQRLKRQILLGEKKFLKPLEEVLEYYIKDTQAQENKLHGANFIQFDTENNQIIVSKSIPDESCKFTKQLLEILKQPFDLSPFESFSATILQENIPLNEISLLNPTQPKVSENFDLNQRENTIFM